MTILERKAEFIRQILDTDDLDFETVEQFFNKLQSGRRPCQESVEEMREGVERATRRYFDGQKGYVSHEELKRK